MRPPRGVTPAHTISAVLGVSAKATNITIAAIAVTSAPAAGTSHWRTRPANTGTQRARGDPQEPRIRELGWQVARGSTKSGSRDGQPDALLFCKAAIVRLQWLCVRRLGFAL